MRRLSLLSERIPDLEVSLKHLLARSIASKVHLVNITLVGGQSFEGLVAGHASNLL